MVSCTLHALPHLLYNVMTTQPAMWSSTRELNTHNLQWFFRKGRAVEYWWSTHEPCSASRHTPHSGYTSIAAWNKELQRFERVHFALWFCTSTVYVHTCAVKVVTFKNAKHFPLFFRRWLSRLKATNEVILILWACTYDNMQQKMAAQPEGVCLFSRHCLLLVTVLLLCSRG